VALGAAFAAVVTAPPLGATEGRLGIELNKLEDTEEGCRSLFVFDNATGHELNRFRVDLILFDRKGVYAKQLLLDMAPLYEDKKVLASFLLADDPCDWHGADQRRAVVRERRRRDGRLREAARGRLPNRGAPGEVATAAAAPPAGAGAGTLTDPCRGRDVLTCASLGCPFVGRRT